jgi:hypothetical protein
MVKCRGRWILSKNQRKTRLKFEKLFRDCFTRPSICSGELGDADEKSVALYTALVPSRKTVKRLQRLLRRDNESRNPYLKWSREDCLTALSSRGIVLHEPDSMTRFECRIALEDADKNISFPFMALPREIRTMVYKHALHKPGFIKRAATVTPALLHTSKQVRKESQPVFLSINRFQLRTYSRTIPTRIDGMLVVHRRSFLILEDSIWLCHIGSANVAKLRYVTITVRGDSIHWPDALHLDLACPDVSKWTRTLPCGCGEGHELVQDSLGKFLKYYARIVKESAAEAENATIEPEWWATRARWIAGRNEDLQKGVLDAQKRMSPFNKHCGEGKGVAPTVGGLVFLASIVCDVLKTMDGRPR